MHFGKGEGRIYILEILSSSIAASILGCVNTEGEFQEEVPSTVFRQSHRGYYFFAALLCAATIQGRLLFKESIYFFGEPTNINNGLIWYVQGIQG